MPAYFIFIRESTTDQAELDIYSAKVGEQVGTVDVRILAAYGPQQTFEGPESEGVVIAEFPSIEAARQWYEGPDYQEVVQHRWKGAVYRAILVEGV
jgi:uncharacterized protein (DUF1330 family)